MRKNPHKSPSTPAPPRLDPAFLAGRRVLVVGDILLDQYIWGQVDRISPEAPVPVVLKTGETEVLGGAVNVARNIAAVGGRVSMVGVVGNDTKGHRVAGLMEEIGIARKGLVVHPTRPTTVKMRIMSGGQQLLRLDHEQAGDFEPEIEKRVVAAIARSMRGVHAVILSDYRKGSLTRRVIEAAAKEAHALGVPIVADPKASDFRHYLGVDWLTPNLKETVQAAGRPLSGDAEITREGRRLMRLYRGKGIVITRGHEGLTLVGAGAAVHIPAQQHEVFDVTGAGDTLIAHFTLALAAGYSPADAARIGNAAAGVAVTKLGAVTVSPQELADALAHAPAETTKR